ncbi:MAG: type II toxin-antitoxin system MqsA family antitoxin [Planctomycetes bacterium]|nr:type II toxin-antitoxin system MqsA family antitoxin [Planctomycetota bacterium]
MVCDICGNKKARVRRITRSFGRGRSTFLIENVPVVSCPSCGESYLTAATLKEIERIRLHWRELAVETNIPLAKFEGAA